MKTTISKYAALVGVMLAFASCIDSDTPDGDVQSERYGSLSISSFDVIGDISERDHGHHTPPNLPDTRAGEEVLPDNFLMTVAGIESDEVVFTGTCASFITQYSETPMTLPVGEYRVDIQSHEHTGPEWDKVHYSVSKLFEIEADSVTDLEELVCKVSSILVSVDYEARMLEALTDDYRVDITIGNQGPHSYFPGETRHASFVAEVESNTIVWDFVGTIKGGTFEGQSDDKYYEVSKTIKNVKAGEHHTLTFSAEFVDKGDGTFDLDIVADADAWNVNLDVEIEDGIVAPLDPNPTDPGSGDDAVSITGNGISAPVNITAAQAGTIPVVINIAAPKGIAELLVDIDSTNAGFGEVAASLGVLNLTEPGESQGLLDSVGLPYGDAVKGKTSLVFPITSFVPMIFMTAGDDPDFTVDFKITVTDTEGASNTKTVKLHLTQE